MKEKTYKAIAAALSIALGDAVLLKIGQPLGPFLFALGLLCVCALGMDLFTGKCGYIIRDGVKFWPLMYMLLINLIAGYVFGLILSFADSNMVEAATTKVANWTMSPAYFIQAIFCGIIMFLAVDVYKKGSSLGVIFGIPLFIFCGFQHCIANVITLGVARSYHFEYILLAALGNFLGSLFISWLLKEKSN